MILGEDEDWRDHAQCLNGNPEDFDPVPLGRIGAPPSRRKTAWDFCHPCAARAECAAFADRTQTQGLLGGSWRLSMAGEYVSRDLLHGDALTKVPLYLQPDGFGDLVDTITGDVVAAKYGYKDANSAYTVLQRAGILPIVRGLGTEENQYVAVDVAKHMNKRGKRKRAA